MKSLKKNNNKMNKSELVEAVSNETGLSKTKSNEVVNTIVNKITESLKNGEKVSLVGFGTWTTTSRPERKGRNPKTGEEITISSRTVAKFKPGNELTKSVN
jgi:DNA-binding protein HU-beta